MGEKQFYLRADQIEALAAGRGSCFASDAITVEGKKVGFMYRQTADNEIDCGWRFLAGDESQQYLDDPNHLEIYDVNTIANYDPSIIPFLDFPVGSAFEWNPRSGQFVAIDFNAGD
jgi:hypothetical protein